MKNKYVQKLISTSLAILMVTQVTCSIASDTDPVSTDEQAPNIMLGTTSSLAHTLRDVSTNLATLRDMNLKIQFDSPTYHQFLQLSKLITALGLIFVGISMSNYGIKKIHKKDRRIPSATQIIVGLSLSIGSAIYLAQHFYT